MLNAVNIAATFQSKLISIDDNLNARENVIRVTNKPRNSRKIVFIEKLSLGFARSISVKWNIYIYIRNGCIRGEKWFVSIFAALTTTHAFFFLPMFCVFCHTLKTIFK